MKVEARCNNRTCVAYTSTQLLSCATFRGYVAYDEDLNPIECPFCGRAVAVFRLSDDSAQFPLGLVCMSSNVIKHFDPHVNSRLTAASIAAEMVACHVRSDPKVSEFGDRIDMTDGRVVTQHHYKGEAVWVMTDTKRNHTYIFLAREYPFYAAA